MKRLYARILAYTGGVIAQLVFNQLTAQGCVARFKNVQVAARTAPEVNKVVSALELLELKHPHAACLVHRWIKSFAFSTDRWRWKNFCDGTLFMHPGRDTPVNRLAAYLYRIAVENSLFQRFGLTEVYLNDPRCKLFAYERELELMKHLDCSADWLNEQQCFVQQYKQKLTVRKRTRA